MSTMQIKLVYLLFIHSDSVNCEFWGGELVMRTMIFSHSALNMTRGKITEWHYTKLLWDYVHNIKTETEQN